MPYLGIQEGARIPPSPLVTSPCSIYGTSLLFLDPRIVEFEACQQVNRRKDQGVAKRPSMVPIKTKQHAITPLVLRPSMLPMKKKHHVITMFAGKEAYVGHCVCKWGAAPPPTPRCFKAKKHHIITRVCSKGRLCGLRCLPPDIFRVYPKPNSHSK